MTFDSLEDEYSYFRELRDKPNGPDVRKDMFYLSRMIDLQAKLDRVTELVAEFRSERDEDYRNGMRLAAIKLERALKGGKR